MQLRLLKGKYYQPQLSNPNPSMVINNEVGPTAVTVEFFIMIAGSLIRACIGEKTKYGTNKLFIDKTKTYECSFCGSGCV